MACEAARDQITSMIALKKIAASSLIALAVLLDGIAFAQNQAGQLGQRYFGASVFTESLRDRNLDNGNGASATFNFPIASNVDLSFGGSYEKFSDYSVEDKRAFGAVRAYREFSEIRPFIDLSLIGTWQSSQVGSVSYSSNDSIWAGGVGLEVPVGDTTALFARAAYHKYFKSENGHYSTYGAGVHHWFTARVGAEASVLFWESDSIVYSVGLNVRF